MTIRANFRHAVQQGHAGVQAHPRLTLLGIIIVLLLLSGWRLTRPGARFGPQDGTWHRIQVNKKLWVGLDPSYPPFAEWTPGKIIGLEADLAREIGQRLGVETHILIMGYDGLYEALYTGTADMLISGLQVDPAYTEWVYYTQPYYDAGHVLVSRDDALVEHIRELDGKIVAVEIASAGEQAARQWIRRLHSLEITQYLHPDDALHAVQTGQADAALVDTVSARLYLNRQHDLVLVHAQKTTVPISYVIALRRENFRLTTAVDRALADMIADGTLQAIIARWL